MRSYAPVDFTKVTLSGDFWRERLETVLSRTIPSQYAKLESEGLLEALLVLDPPPPLRIPRRRERLHHPDLLGQRHRQVDRGGELRAAPPPRRRRSRREIDDIVDEARNGRSSRTAT